MDENEVTPEDLTDAPIVQGMPGEIIYAMERRMARLRHTARKNPAHRAGHME